LYGASKPERQGFGTRFVEGSVKSELQGRAVLDYDPSGLVCTMDIPLEETEPVAEGREQL
jgi:two-component sensor histidine kinase